MSHDIESALQLHQQGRLDAAALIYKQVIAESPQNAVAWNLLGVVAHQKGDSRDAIKLISQGIALNPKAPSFHANLAEAYRAVGQSDLAISHCQIALQLDPKSASTLNNLGLAWQDLGNSDLAITQFEAAVRIQPDFALAHNNLGTALKSLGRTDEALVHFRQSVILDPNLAIAHSNLGQLLLERYQRQESLHHCQAAVRLNPHFSEAQNNLGNVLRELGQFSEARACYLEALRLKPGLATTCNNLGQLMQEEGNYDAALGWYRRGLQIDPNSALIHSHLGSLLHEQEQFDAATEHFHRAIQLDPNYAEAYHGLGWVLHDQSDFTAAQLHYREALKRRPDLALAHCSLGTLLLELGDFVAAERSFRDALMYDPYQSIALAQLATLKRAQLPASDRAVIEKLVMEPHLSENKRAALYFGLAQVEDARGDHQAAGEDLRHANALSVADRQRRGKTYDAAQHDQFVAGLIETFSPGYFERVKGLGSDSEQPIFVIGLPRSGTTLTEQILASHSRVSGAGELGLAGTVFHSLPKLISRDASPCDCFAQLDANIIESLSLNCLERLSKRSGSAPHVVDKMPDNYLYLGLIATLFPRSKIIHCRRDLRDIAVSCWMTNFRQIHWASDFEQIASRFAAYQRLMEHWRRVLPMKILDVNYEQTVSDVELSAVRLLEWCGLEWEPSCVTFHQQTRPIRTASVTQVRQPIYGNSVARWRRYEKELAPLFALLPQIEQPN